jgi:hypothetical protein
MQRATIVVEYDPAQVTLEGIADAIPAGVEEMVTVVSYEDEATTEAVA